MIQKPKTDPVIEEIHKVRRETSDRFNGDVQAIAADANARMVVSGCPVWKPSVNHKRAEAGQSDVIDQSSPRNDQ